MLEQQMQWDNKITDRSQNSIFIPAFKNILK